MVEAPKYPCSSRVLDIADPASPLLAILGPRSFTAAELLVFANELRRLEYAINVLAQWVNAHRAMALSLGTFKPDTVCFNMLAADPGQTLVIGELSLVGATMISRLATVAQTDATVGIVGSMTLKYNNTVLAALSCSTYAAHAMLRALPSAIYHSMGSLLEEVAATYYKGRGPDGALTSIERAALIRLQDKITKIRCERAEACALSTKDGIIFGPEALAGELLADQHAPAVVRAIAPTIGAWLYDNEPTGLRAYTAAGTT